MYSNSESSMKPVLPSNKERTSCFQSIAKWFDNSQPAGQTGVQSPKGLGHKYEATPDYLGSSLASISALLGSLDSWAPKACQWPQDCLPLCSLFFGKGEKLGNASWKCKKPGYTIFPPWVPWCSSCEHSGGWCYGVARTAQVKALQNLSLGPGLRDGSPSPGQISPENWLFIRILLLINHAWGLSRWSWQGLEAGAGGEETAGGEPSAGV